MSLIKRFSSSLRFNQSYRKSVVQMSVLKDMDLLEGAEEELAASAPQRRNWRGILIAFSMIVFISSIILAIIFFISPLDANANSTKKPLTLKDAINPSIMGHIEAVEWMDSGKLVIRANDEVEVMDFEAEPRRNWTLFDNEVFNRYGKVKSTHVVYGTPYIDITYSVEKNKPHVYSKVELKRIYDTKTGKFDIVGAKRTGDEDIIAFAFNPSGDGYMFVQDYNLYFRPSFGSSELVQLTSDGNTDLRHGTTSWAYTEEIFGPKSFWWSPDGEEIIYMTTNLTGIQTYNINWYGGKIYPETQVERYAKAGVRNLEQIQFRIWQKSTRRTTDLTIDIPEQKRVYLMYANFLRLHGQNVLVAIFANRFQDELTYALCTLKSGKCVPTYYQSFEIGDMHQYATSEQMIVTPCTDDSFFTLLPNKRPSGDVFTQIARITVPKDFRHAQEDFLAMGDQEVDKIHIYNQKTNRIYFTSPAPVHRQLHLYSTLGTPQPGIFSAHCVTCNVSSNCTYHDTTFAPNSTKFYMNCKGIGPTTVFVADVDSSDNVTVLAEFGQTSERERELISKKLPHAHFENVTLSNGFVSFVQMYLPHGVTLDTIHKKYPVLVYVYGGPNSHSVHEEWLPVMPVDIYFASNLEYIIVYIDGRGTGNAGWKRRQALYGHFGTVEIDDQIETMKLLLEKHKFMDKKRVGIWGWSYGGFVAGHVIAKDTQHVFKCGAMIAPVVYFKMYDAIYTERYMGNASEHAYDLTNIANNVTNFHYARTLLVHGTGDDNVHFQNAAELISALVRENVQFNLMVYPDERHSLKNVRSHVFETIISFFRNCMDRPPPMIPSNPPPSTDAESYKPS